MAASGNFEPTRPTLFFDRSVGTRIPRTLRSLGVPVGIEHHQQHFDRAAPDDLWLPIVGSNGWTVVGFDWSYHQNQAELAALRRYGIGVFYLWGVQRQTWERMFCLARAYERIIRAIDATPRPFIYRVRKSGQLQRVALV